MPRISPSLFRRHPLLSLIHRECRDLEAAARELRWLREDIPNHLPSRSKRKLLTQWCLRRSRGEPLQYILGSQPFGPLDIKCRTGVLIPRPETETIVTQLCNAVKGLNPRNAVDFCTGTGCIALYIAEALNIGVTGYDISATALSVAHENLERNAAAVGNRDVRFEQLDALALANQSISEIRTAVGDVDVMVSNPPYISQEDFEHGQTARSVRLFEPRLALVPPAELAFPNVQRADQFYEALLRIAAAIKPKVLMMEVGDTAQAIRVKQMCDFANDSMPRTTEIWNDNGDSVYDIATRALQPTDVPCRAVVVWFDAHWCQDRQRR